MTSTERAYRSAAVVMAGPARAGAAGRKRTLRQTYGWALAAVTLLSCSSEPEGSGRIGPSHGRPTAAAANYPLKYFTERIAQGEVDVVLPAPPNVDPAFWLPDSVAIRSFQEADLILLNGASYSKWVGVVSLPMSRVVITADRFSDQLLPIAAAVSHSHGPAGEHSHAGTAFTTWLDPGLALRQAQAIREALKEAWPHRTAVSDSGYRGLEMDLLALDDRLEEVFTPFARAPLMASHPVYQYLAARYDLDIRAVQWEPDQPPTRSMWLDLASKRRERPFRIMLWEAEPLPDTAARLREMEVEPVVFRPCGNVPTEGDYLSVMRANADRVAAAARG